MADEKAWSEYWGGAGGAEAVGGAHRHKLADRWAEFFARAETRTADAPVAIDIAAGAGVALQAAISAYRGAGLFVAFDYSAAAVASAVNAHKAAHGVAADAARAPFATGCADFVISQFGVEYAGDGAFAEAARLVASGGKFYSISHYRGGAIDLECAENEKLLVAVEKTLLFKAARATLAASYARQSRRDPKPIDLALDSAFATALGKAASAVRAAPARAARATIERFLGDLTRLSARRFAFEPADAIGWLGGMEASLGAYLGRMRSMRAAALDRGKVDAIGAQFQAAGLNGFRAEPLFLDENNPPAAWVIEAGRPD